MGNLFLENTSKEARINVVRDLILDPGYVRLELQPTDIIGVSCTTHDIDGNYKSACTASGIIPYSALGIKYQERKGVFVQDHCTILGNISPEDSGLEHIAKGGKISLITIEIPALANRGYQELIRQNILQPFFDNGYELSGGHIWLETGCSGNPENPDHIGYYPQIVLKFDTTHFELDTTKHNLGAAEKRKLDRWFKKKCA